VRYGALLALGACSFDVPAGAIDAPSRDARADGPPADVLPIDAPPIDAPLPPPIDAPPDAFACPPGYVASGGSLYRFVTTPKAWLDAETDCDDDGAGTHLAIAPTSAELATIDAMTTASTTWVGLSDRTKMLWQWVDGSLGPVLDATNFGRCGSYYNAAGNNGSKHLQDEDCTRTKNFMCECDMIEPDPTAF
jgi:hypothetical protein